MKRRSGYTLLELMIVTTIIAILGMIASIPIRQVRERSFVAASKQEVKNALKGVVMYEADTDSLPRALGDVDEYYEPGDGIDYCAWTYVAGATPSQDYVQIDAIHRGAQTGVTTKYPTDNGLLTEKKMPNCVPIVVPPSSKKSKRKRATG